MTEKKNTCKIKVLSTRKDYVTFGGITYNPVKVCYDDGTIMVVYLDDLYVNIGDELEIRKYFSPVNTYNVLKNYTQQKIIDDFVKQK